MVAPAGSIRQSKVLQQTEAKQRSQELELTVASEREANRQLVLQQTEAKQRSQELELTVASEREANRQLAVQHAELAIRFQAQELDLARERQEHRQTASRLAGATKRSHELESEVAHQHQALQAAVEEHTESARETHEARLGVVRMLGEQEAQRRSDEVEVGRRFGGSLVWQPGASEGGGSLLCASARGEIRGLAINMSGPPAAVVDEHEAEALEAHHSLLSDDARRKIGKMSEGTTTSCDGNSKTTGVLGLDAAAKPGCRRRVMYSMLTVALGLAFFAVGGATGARWTTGRLDQAMLLEEGLSEGKSDPSKRREARAGSVKYDPNLKMADHEAQPEYDLNLKMEDHQANCAQKLKDKMTAELRSAKQQAEEKQAQLTLRLHESMTNASRQLALATRQMSDQKDYFTSQLEYFSSQLREVSQELSSIWRPDPPRLLQAPPRWAFVMIAYSHPDDPPRCLWQTLAMARNLQLLSKYPLLVLTNTTHFPDGTEVKAAFAAFGALVQPVFPVGVPKVLEYERWMVAWWKLQIWTLTQYERLIWLDGDTMVYRSIDDLFEREGMWGQRDDWFCNLNQVDLCSGILALTPSMDDYHGLLEFADRPGADLSKGDQKVMQDYFASIGRPVNLLSDLEAAFGQCLGTAPSPYRFTEATEASEVKGLWNVPSFIHKTGGYPAEDGMFYSVCFQHDISLQLFRIGETTINTCHFNPLATTWRSHFCEAIFSARIWTPSALAFCSDDCWLRGRATPEWAGYGIQCGPVSASASETDYAAHSAGVPLLLLTV